MFIQVNTNFPGLEGTVPAPIQILTDASYATVITAGFLTAERLAPANIAETNWVWVVYDYVTATGQGTFGIFTVSISSGGVITLAPYIGEGNVALPVTNGHFANFDGTTGKIEDAGFAPSNATLDLVVMTDSNTVAPGDLMAFTANGSAQGIGATLLYGNTTTYAGGGTSNAFTVNGLTAASFVQVTLRASANVVSFSAVPSTDTLTVTYSADPGAGTIMTYLALTPIT